MWEKIIQKILSAFSDQTKHKIIQKYLSIRSYFYDVPHTYLLERWAKGEWADYQSWLDYHSLDSVTDWKDLRKQAKLIENPPKISILVPTYNTNLEFFEDLIRSVLFQTYPFWELCIVDDGSYKREFLNSLKKVSKRDSRIKVEFLNENRGICYTTNRALELADGEYVAFLDHDDRLSPDALHYMSKEIIKDREIDILYSDRDMVSPNGNRLMHLLKPDWSPETLLSMNYIFHLMIYRKELLIEIGGLRKEYEGSQDYDLILRTIDLKPIVCHVPRILYHWRQHEFSVALNLESKNYAFSAGVNALKDSLKRRGLTGDVIEIKDLPRGHYKVSLTPPHEQSYEVFNIIQNDSLDRYHQKLINKICKVIFRYISKIGKFFIANKSVKR